MNTKKCKVCEEDKPLEDFHKSSASKDGHQPKCKTCKSALAKAYREDNRDLLNSRLRERRQQNASTVIEQQREYRRKNKERIRKAHKAWRDANPDRIKGYVGRYYSENCEKMNLYRQHWRRANKGIVNAKTARRRAQRLNASVCWANKQSMKIIYNKAQRLSVWLEDEYHVDHIVPLVSGVVCGLHNEFNLQILHWRDNLQKSNSWWPDMPN